MSASVKENVPWRKRVGQSIPGIEKLSVTGTRIVLLMVFFASLAIAAIQMLAPGWIWGRLQAVLPQNLTQNVAPFWLPIVLHGDLYRARFNREIYSASVSRDGTVWIGGEQGLLAFSKNRGESWTCLSFETKTGGFNNPHECNANDTNTGMVAANTRSLGFPRNEGLRSPDQ